MNTPATIAPTTLPALPLDDRRNLPDAPAIYFVMSGDTVLYVGQSVNLRQRWVAHHRLAQLNEHGGCRVAWMTVDDAGLLDELEQACIEHFSPMLNSSPVLWDELATRPVTLRLTPSLVDDIKSLARTDRRPYTDWIRVQVEEVVERRQGELGRP